MFYFSASIPLGRLCSGGMDQHSSSGKRIRKPSLLYEDFESPSLPHTIPQGPPILPQPPVTDPNRQSRMTNQLQFLQRTVVKCLWRHHFAWPFYEPVDPHRLNLPVSNKMASIYFSVDVTVQLPTLCPLCKILLTFSTFQNMWFSFY